MNDKIKGLVIGALLGSAITGTAAYASGTSIEVLFRPIKFLFDGVEKKPSEGTAFQYEGSTYVPLRFVSESLGKEVGWDEATGTVTIDEPGSRNVLGAYKDGDRVISITRARLNKQLAIAQFYNPSYKAYVDDSGFIAQNLQDLAVYYLAEGRADSGILEAAKAQAPTRLADLKTKFAAAFQGQMEWSSRLKELNLTEDDLLDYLRLNSIRTAYFKSLITDEQLKAVYNDAIQNHQMDTATVRHVLVGFTASDGTTRTKEEALARAKEALEKLRSGADFANIARAYSDDPGSKDNGGWYDDAPVNQWVSAFKETVLKQDLGMLSDPVETEYGYHIILVKSRHTPSLEELRDTLTNKLLQSGIQSFYQNELPKLTVSTN